MSTITIANLPSAGGIDGAADYLAIETASPHATNKINRNTFLGVTAQPVDISSSQTLTNKVLGITNTVTLLDTLFTLQDNSDNTKQALFQLSGITTGTTRTYTLPNVSDTLVSLTATQTLTNKTLTAPAITGGTIDNATITVDSIAGHSTSTIVSVANMQISNGVINTANAVTATSIAAGAIQPQALQSGTGSGWAMQPWTPTWTNLTVGNGTVTARYIQIGKIVFYRIGFVFGSTSSIGGIISYTFPVTTVSYSGTSTVQPIGNLKIFDVSASATFNGFTYWASTTTGRVKSFSVSGSAVGDADTSSSSPMTWALNDEMYITGWVEAA